MANLKFYHSNAFPTTGIKEGAIYFSSSDHTIGVGTASGIEKYYGGNVSNASFADKKLTISLFNGSAINLDFSDVASTQGVTSLFSSLRDDINNLQAATGIADGSEAPSYTGANYISDSETLVAADIALDSKIKEIADKVGSSNVSTQITNAINALDDTVTAQEASEENGWVNADVTQVDGVVTSISVSIAEDSYDAYGSAAEVLGSSTDAKTANTVYGAKAYAKSVETTVNNLTATKSGSAENDSITVSVSQKSGAIDSVTVTSTIKSDVIGASTDEKTADTIYGAKAYAKDYTDTEIGKLDYTSSQGAAGKYVQKVSESNGIVSDVVVAFDTTISDASTDNNAPTSKAVYDYVQGAVADLNGAMHFVGVIASLPTASKDDSYSNGDVILVGTKEYVRSGKSETADGSWVELGDESLIGTTIAGLKAENTVTGTKENGWVSASIKEVDGKINSFSVSLDSSKYDEAGAADQALSNAKDYADGIETSLRGGYTGDIKGINDRLAALESGDNSVATQISNAIEALDTPDGGVSNEAASAGTSASSQIEVTVEEENGVISSVSVNAPKFDLDGAASTAEQNAKNYADGLKTTIDAYTVNGKAISTNPSLDAGDINVDDDAETKETIAAALSRIDQSIKDKNVSASGDNQFISASATNNNVSVSGTYAEMSVTAEPAEGNRDTIEGSVTTDGIVTGTTMKNYVDDMLEWVVF